MPGMSLLASGLDYTGNVLETISDKRVRSQVLDRSFVDERRFLV